MEVTKQTILIVDDEPVNIEILNEALSLDYEIIASTNGREALEIAAREKPDLILLDVVMPEPGGYEVIGVLKKSAALKDIPVIFITALDKVEAETRGLELGAVDYITKPFNLAIVKLRVRSHLELKSQRDMLGLKNKELQEALKKVRVLSGLLPICSSCKRIRDDHGYWNQLEMYIRDHSDADFSHGLCPECAKKMYPQYFKSKADEGKGTDNV